jgi:probable rRNA maturation factor
MATASHDPADSDPPDWLCNRQRSVRFDARGFRDFAAVLRRRVAQGREFSVCLASEQAVRRANRQFRRQDRVTDLLSFPDGASGTLGEILICARQAERQAKALGHSVDEELKVLVLHGLLHLLGHDHERDEGQMRRLEQRWRRRLQLPAGLIERNRPPQRVR